MTMEITPEQAWARGWTQEPNLDAEFPSGMCGKPKVCEECPSHFLCTMKARAEMDAINARKVGNDAANGGAERATDRTTGA